MFDPKKLLDALMGAARQSRQQPPGTASATATGGGRKPGGSLPVGLASLGGLAIIGGLAYKAFRNSQAGRTPLERPQESAGQGGVATGTPGATPGGGAPGATGSAAPAAPAGQGGGAAEPAGLDVPEASKFHPVSQTEDDALLFLRTMVAAAACDGRIAAAERERITRGLIEAGIDPEATRWLDRELESPADVEELAARVTNAEKAAQVYAAARMAIDPDTLQEREFLHRLAEALDLDEAVRAQIDSTAGALREAS